MARVRAKTKQKTMEEVVGITEEQLKQLIDAYGEVDEKIKELQKKKDNLRQAFLDYGLPEGSYEGNVYRLDFSTRMDPVLSVDKTYKLVGSIKRLLPLVSVSVSKARKELSAMDFEKCIDKYKQIKVLSVKRR